MSTSLSYINQPSENPPQVESEYSASTGYDYTNQGDAPEELNRPLIGNARIEQAISSAQVCPDESQRLSQRLNLIVPEKTDEYADIILRCSQAAEGTEVIKAKRKRSTLSQSVGVGKKTAYFHGVDSPVIARGSKKKAKVCTAVSLDTGSSQIALRLKDSNVDPGADREGEIHEQFSSHPNVVALLDKRTYYSKFKKKREIYVEKADSTMESAISNPKFDLTGKAIAMHGIATAVAHMHSENMCHNDLNLGNLFIKDGIGKISDFGLSAPSGNRLPVVFAAIRAPEQEIRINPITNMKEFQGVGSFATDVYQFGHALWHVFHPDPNHLHLEISDKELPPKIRYAVPDQENRFNGWRRSTVQEDMAIELIQDCMHNDPADRPTMNEVVVRLAEIAEINAFFNTFDDSYTEIT